LYILLHGKKYSMSFFAIEPQMGSANLLSTIIWNTLTENHERTALRASSSQDRSSWSRATPMTSQDSTVLPRCPEKKRRHFCTSGTHVGKSHTRRPSH